MQDNLCHPYILSVLSDVIHNRVAPQNTTMPYSEYVKHRTLYFHGRGLTSSAIVDALAAKGEAATWQGIAQMRTGSLKRSSGSGRLPKLTPAIRAAVDAQMRMDDETTAMQLEAILRRHRIQVSKSTILHSRSAAYTTTELTLVVVVLLYRCTKRHAKLNPRNWQNKIRACRLPREKLKTERNGTSRNGMEHQR